MLALAAARKSFARAFSFGGSTTRGHVAAGSSVCGVGRRLFAVGGGKYDNAEKPSCDDTGSAGSAGSLAGAAAAATPPESPFPPGDDADVVSFFLLRHGQTNFNAIGRIQVLCSKLDCCHSSKLLCSCGVKQAGTAVRTQASSGSARLFCLLPRNCECLSSTCTDCCCMVSYHTM